MIQVPLYFSPLLKASVHNAHAVFPIGLGFLNTLYCASLIMSQIIMKHTETGAIDSSTVNIKYCEIHLIQKHHRLSRMVQVIMWQH